MQIANLRFDGACKNTDTAEMKMFNNPNMLFFIVYISFANHYLKALSLLAPKTALRGPMLPNEDWKDTTINPGAIN